MNTKEAYIKAGYKTTRRDVRCALYLQLSDPRIKEPCPVCQDKTSDCPFGPFNLTGGSFGIK